MSASKTAIACALHVPGAPYSYEITGAPTDDARTAGAFTAELCALELGIEAPALFWFRSTTGPVDPERGAWQDRRNVLGRALPEFHAIIVRADLSPAEVVETTAHECRHLQWFALGEGDERYPRFKEAPDRHEEDADAYGLRMKAWFQSGSRIHAHDGFAYNGTLAGVAERGDLLIAEGPTGSLALFRNDGGKAWPEWTEISARRVTRVAA